MNDHALRRARYFEWLTSKSIPFNFPAEISNLADRVSKGVRNDTPPIERWHRILPTLEIAVKVRERFGATVINSAYRSLTYNIAVGGVGDSRHSQNDALDISCVNATPEQVRQFLNTLRATGRFSGGIGIYRTFVHVDTRGTDADWRGK
jgi:uncharacterized protein YcbK (DUF882 family)